MKDKRYNIVIAIIIIIIFVSIFFIYRNSKKLGQTIQASTGINPFNDFMTPEGIKNNNPLNIKHNDNIKWQGELPGYSNGQITAFESLELGIRAAEKNLNTYISVDNVNKITDIINRWAPESDNNNDVAYLKVVLEKMSSINSYWNSGNLTISKQDIPLLAWAMSNMEVGEKHAPNLSLFQSVFTNYNI